jgi:hypothetical protein
VSALLLEGLVGERGPDVIDSLLDPVTDSRGTVVRGPLLFERAERVFACGRLAMGETGLGASRLAPTRGSLSTPATTMGGCLAALCAASAVISSESETMSKSVEASGLTSPCGGCV